MSELSIIADENIPFVNELFSLLGKVKTCAGREMSACDVSGADALLVRSVTNVNKTLLHDTDVRYVGTCTIGTDHCDQDYFQKKNIHFASAPGCNANGVVQYVMAVLAKLNRLDYKQKVGIIGCGNVGGRLYNALSALGFDCVCVDPFLSLEEHPNLVAFEEIFHCDIVSMHTPFTRGGTFPTCNLVSKKELQQLKPNCLLINAGRGECINNDDLLEHLNSDCDLQVALDVWANEPAINPALAKCVDIATPHIAGYSFEGRVNGSFMIFESLARFMGKSDAWILQALARAREAIYGEKKPIVYSNLSQLIQELYPIEVDHKRMLEALDTLPQSFDVLRKTYLKRREFSHYQIGLGVLDEAAKLKALGFECE